MGWDDCIVTDPRRAYSQGAPNQLVLQRRKRGEEHLVAVARVKREDFLRLNPGWYAEHVTGIVPGKNVPGGDNLSPVEVVMPGDGLSDNGITTGLCAVCGAKPREKERTKCSACRKRSQRGD